MEYVELLRVRRALVWFVVALAFVLVMVNLVLHGKGGFTIHIGFGKDGVAAGDLVLLGGLGALFLAAVFAGNLPGESTTLPFLWTKPVSRTALAYRFVAVDVLGMIGGIVATALAAVIVIAGLGQIRAIHLDRALLSDAALALGAPLAWYGLTFLAAARLRPEGVARAGALSWPVFIVIAMLTTVTLPPPLHGLVLALDHLNPLAYIAGGDQKGMGLLSAAPAIRGAACWAIALVTIPAAIRLWTVREA
ncbi:MAG: hypothetical protein QOJ39_959 [Candidatus Eremiobacteraeota bacterium]|jgi:hypothetical protein|nr:hypothetical protein [Candidatus Eremiobacteraeota bacterium]